MERTSAGDPGHGPRDPAAEFPTAEAPLPEEGAANAPPPCPFCGWSDSTCGHLLVAADRTFMEFHGEDFDRYVGPAEELLRRAIGPCLGRVSRLPTGRRERLLGAIQPPRLRALLFDALEAWPEPLEEDDESILGDRPRWDYLEEVLLSTGDTVGLPWDLAAAPGESSEMIDFWSSDPTGAAQEARELILADVAALDRLLV